jgi:hypothetical protein
MKTTGLSALLALLLVLPFAGMELINRRQYNESFPGALFFGLWLNLFAIALLLLPILQAWLSGKRAPAAAGDVLPISPRASMIVSLLAVAPVAALFVLNSLGREPLERLLTVLGPLAAYLPGQVLSLFPFALLVAAGGIAAAPLANSLRSGGRLWAHPVHLLLVAGIVAVLAAGVIGLLVDQWPCFLGVPVCD